MINQAERIKKLKVCKFGGSSMADARRISNVGQIIKADPNRRIVVVSAPGKRSPTDTKVTDLLTLCAEESIAGKDYSATLIRVINRYKDIQVGLGLESELLHEIELDFSQRLQSDCSHQARFLDLVKAGGEDNMAKLMAAYLRSQGIYASYLNPCQAGLLLNDWHGKARVLDQSYDNLKKLTEKEYLVVFPGFFGCTPEGHIVTFPRGGSDITGAVLAAAVGAEVYENFTDVDSVFVVNPNIIPHARTIPELTFREMRELAYAGFEVLHDEAIVPLVKAGIPIHIMNSNKPDAAGTLVVAQRDDIPGRVVGIAGSRGFTTIFVRKFLMNREIGFGRRLLQILEEESLSYEHTLSGIDDMSIIIRESQLTTELEQRLLAKIQERLSVDEVFVKHGYAMIMLVGERLCETIGLLAKATRALQKADVHVEMINQGSSEVSMMFGVKEEDRERSIQALYNVFFD
jgi:aspartate kinase